MGFSRYLAVELGTAAAVLGGRPVAALRVSQADPRERHRGVSHHSITSYGRVALCAADVVVPVGEGEPWARVREQAATLCEPVGRHRLVEVPTDGLRAALADSPVRLSTMGRGLEDDEAAFVASAAAGVHAATVAD